jgi:hypothetical protein
MILTVLGRISGEIIRIVGQAAIGVLILIGMAYVFLLRPRGPRYR